MIEEQIGSSSTIALPEPGASGRLRTIGDFTSAWVVQPFLVGAVALVAALIYVWTPSTLSPTFDDSFISLTFARNLAEHGKMGFDGTSWSTGATSPLHVFIVANLIKLGLTPINAAISLGVVCTVWLSIATYFLGWAVFQRRNVALLAGLFISLTPFVAFDAGNGLETSLFMALLATTFAVYLLLPTVRGRMATGTLIAIAVLVRPEALALAPAVMLYRYYMRRQDETWNELFEDAFLLMGPAILMFQFVILYNVLAGDSFLGTAGAKMKFFQEEHLTIRQKIADGSDNIALFAAPLLPLILLAAFAFQQRVMVLFGAFWTIVIAGYVGLFPGGMEHYFYRYQHPILPILAVFAAGGFFVVLERMKAQTELLPKLMLGGVLAAVVIVGGFQYARWRDLYGIAASETHNDLEAMVLDLNKIVAPGETVATHDIGAVGYFGKFHVLDLVGLVNAEVGDYHSGRRLAQYVDQKKPQYLLVMPDWDRDLLRIHPDARKEQFELVKEYPAARIRRESYMLYRVHYPEPPLP
jgi:hypothetical protein